MLLLTWPIIAKLLHQSADELEELTEQYGRLPLTRCQRKTHCCSLLPEMTFIETLLIFQRMAAMESVERLALIRKISGYYFLNAARITACPFLDSQTCLVYEDRFLGCRAYGLWSPAHYQEIAGRSQTAKRYLQKQWLNLGVRLPQAVVDFRMPYCLDVQTLENVDLDDWTLIEISEAIDTLSRNLSETHQSFQESYFSDFSFLVAALLFGYRAAVQIKFDVVKDFIDTGRTYKLDTILNGISDPFFKTNTRAQRNR
jgi:Fe-S-cluster containining protein